MRTQQLLRLLVICSAVLSSAVVTAEECSIDARCNNPNFRFRVVYTETGANVTGQCQASFEEALSVFEGLQGVGQCARNGQSDACAVDGRCSNPNYAFRVVRIDDGINVTGACQSTMEEAVGVFRGLRITGQCVGGEAQACMVDGRCNNDNFPYRVVFAGDGSNVTGQCWQSFGEVVHAFHLLEETGQCRSGGAP
jgi:hypothetical protein